MRVATDNLTMTAPEETEHSRSAGSGPSVLNLIRFVIPTIIVVGVFALLTNHAKDPLSNTDTYFHLRFGHEFLTGNWSLTDPGSVTTFGTDDWVPTQWLPQVVMAQLEDWFGLAGVAWLSGLLYLALALTLWTIARRHASPLAAAPVTVVAIIAASPGHVDASAGAQLPADRCDDGRVAPDSSGRQGPLVAGAAHVGVGDGPRHVAASASSSASWPLVGLALDRAVTAAPVAATGGDPSARLPSRPALTPVGPRAVLGGAGGELAEPVLRGVAAAGLHRRQRHRAAGPVRPSSSSGSRAGRRSSRGPSCSSCCWRAGSAVYTNRTVMRGGRDARPLRRRGHPGGAARAAARCLAWSELSVLGAAVVCLAVLAILVPRTADQPPGPPTYPDWLSDSRRSCRPAPRCSTTGARAAT